MMMRLIRRASWALGRAERGYADAPGGDTPARDVILGMQVRWLEVVGRETTARHRAGAEIAADLGDTSPGRQPPRLVASQGTVGARLRTTPKCSW